MGAMNNMWTYPKRKNLRETEYTRTPTYKKYSKYVGKLIMSRYWAGFKNNQDGTPFKDENGERVEMWSEKIYMIAAVVPQKYYSNRYAFKLIACGEHQDTQEGAAELVKKINTNNSWKILESGNEG
jgi:hypothetical protein